MDNSDYSDLTDLSDEEDEYRASGSKKKKRTSSPSAVYRIRNALKAPRATTYTAQALYDQMHNDDIKLDPDYQRDVVWPDSKMVGLIDSVFRNFYVPPVIFSVVSYDDGTEKRICIDGKQRLTSIQRFMDGLIPHKDPITSQKLWYADTGAGGGKLKKKLLPLKYRKLFANKQIVCVEYTDVTDHDEREIFQRVQLGMALTPAEKLQVVSTPRSAFIRALLSHFLTSSPASSEDGAGSLAHFDWERSRGADYRSISQMVYCLYTFPAFAPPGPATDALRALSLKNLGAVTTLEKFLLEPAPFTDDFQEHVRAALRVVGAMAGDCSVLAVAGGKETMEVKDVFRRPTRVAPVELVLVGLLVGSHMAEAGCTGGAKKDAGLVKLERGETEAREAEGRRRLAEGVRRMRAEVRETHVDIRMNARVAKTMVDFVRQWRPGALAAAVVGSSTSIGKRKRGQESAQDGELEDGEEDEDGEDVPFRQKIKKTEIAVGASVKVPPPPQGAAVGLPLKPLVSPVVTAPPRPDRMAALRAAKMQMQAAGGAGLPSPQRSHPSGSTAGRGTAG